MANNITLSYPSAFHHQFLDLNGKPLTGGKLYTYIAGSTTPVVTYKTISGGTESANRNTNPIILDMAGMAELVIATDTAYKFVLFDKNDAKIAEWDNVTGNIGGGGGGSEDIVVVGTPNEIDVSGSVIQGVKRYVISLSNSVKITILQLIGLYNNVLNSLGNKADKVQGATAGNLAALDASGNLTDSGSKSADFKTKQTPVPDPSASGAGLDFIDSVTQDANGVITPHKKTIQDGTTAQKGVIKLSNAIDSTSVTEAATPKAVKDAYDELNNKIVARATFLSQDEWAVQSQLQGDPAKVYYVENGTGEDAYTVYVWKESTSTYEEVDESSIDLDGYWHDSPTTTGSGNVVTDITLGNDGVPQVTKGLTALTQHQSVTDNDPTLAWGTRSKVGTIGGTDLHVTMPSNPASGKLDTTGDASNTTSTFTKASGDSSSMTSGGKLSVLFTAISSFFASLKALAFKDKASYNDLSSGVQSSLDKADSALQSHQSVTDNNPTLAWGTTSKVGKVGSTDLRVTMPANPAASKEDAFICNGSSSPYVVFEKNISTALYDGERFEMISSLGNNTYKIVGRLRFPTSTAEAPLNNCSLVFASYPEKPSYEFYYKTTVIGSSTWLTIALHLLNVGPSVVTVKPRSMSMSVETSFDITGYTQLDSFPTLINMRDASWINSGTFGTDRIADDAITAAKVKDNETLPVNVSGTAKHLDCFGMWHTYGTGYYNPSNPYAIIGELNLNLSGNTGAGQLLQFELDSGIYARIRLDIKWSNGLLQRANALIIDSSIDYSALQDWIKITHFTFTSSGNSFLCIRLYVKFTGEWQVWRVRQLDCQTGDCGFTNWADFPLRTGTRSQEASAYGTLATYKFQHPCANGQVGSPATPVYVDSNGQVQQCDPSQMGVGAAEYAVRAPKHSNNAEIYLHHIMPDSQKKVWHIRGIMNGAVNHVKCENVDCQCSITIDAPTLATGEEYDYVVDFNTFTNCSGGGGIGAENCKPKVTYDDDTQTWKTTVTITMQPSATTPTQVVHVIGKMYWVDNVTYV